MNDYLHQWTYKRVIQLLIGSYFIYGYFKDPMLFALLFGVLMSFQAIANVGCFSTRGCSTAVEEHTASEFSENDEIDFEEVK